MCLLGKSRVALLVCICISSRICNFKCYKKGHVYSCRLPVNVYYQSTCNKTKLLTKHLNLKVILLKYYFILVEILNLHVTGILRMCDRAGEKDVDEAHAAGAHRAGRSERGPRQR